MVLEVTSQDGRTLIVGNDLSWFYSPPPTSNHHLTNLPQDLVFIAGKDLSLGTIQQHFNKIKFAGLSIKTKTIKCGKHGAILMMDEFSENFQKAFDKIYCNFSKVFFSLKSQHR